MAIAVFYALGTGLGGVVAPWLFGALIDTGSRLSVFAGYLLAAVLMLVAAGVTLRLGLRAERQPLERVARPLSAVPDERREDERQGDERRGTVA